MYFISEIENYGRKIVIQWCRLVKQRGFTTEMFYKLTHSCSIFMFDAI